MIDFNGSGILARLKKTSNSEYSKAISSFLTESEAIIATYKSIRDAAVFTDKRIITINVQGVTGKKLDFTSIPYSKITTFSVETAGLLDFDSELEIYISGLGKIKLSFTGSTDVKEICKIISKYTLV